MIKDKSYSFIPKISSLDAKEMDSKSFSSGKIYVDAFTKALSNGKSLLVLIIRVIGPFEKGKIY